MWCTTTPWGKTRFIIKIKCKLFYLEPHHSIKAIAIKNERLRDGLVSQSLTGALILNCVEPASERSSFAHFFDRGVYDERGRIDKRRNLVERFYDKA